MLKLKEIFIEIVFLDMGIATIIAAIIIAGLDCILTLTKVDRLFVLFCLAQVIMRFGNH